MTTEMKPLTVGSEVRYGVSSWCTRVGVVVEVDGDRARVSWSRRQFTNGVIIPADGKRTWVKSTRLTVS